MGVREATDLFGPFVEALPRGAGDVRPWRQPSGRAARPQAPEGLHLEAGVTSVSATVGRRRSLTALISVLAHSVGLAATLALPLLLSSALPPPTDGVRAFLVEPLVLAPPPPPPPPPAPAAAAAVEREPPRATPDPQNALVAPVEIPAEIRPEEGLDLGLDGGVPGGVAGGVPGGVVGGVVGGLPDSPLAEPPPVRPLRVSGLVREPVKVKHVSPVYPAAAVAGKVEGRVVVEALVDVGGRVVEVKVLEGHSLFEKPALEAVRQWVYTPTLVDGVPVPLLLTVTVRFELSD